jgi:TP901 family phage tail tape measure protein
VVNAARVVESVGLRAILYDVRRYIGDANSLTQANSKIDAAVLKSERISAGVAQRNLNTQRQVSNALRREQQAKEAFTNAQIKGIQKLEDAEQKALNLRAKRSGLQRAGANISQIAKLDDQVKAAETAAKRIQQENARINLSPAGFRVDNATAAREEAEIHLQQVKRAGEQAEEDAVKHIALLQAQADAEAIARRKTLITLTAVGAGAIVLGGAAVAISQAAKYETELGKVNGLTNATDEETKQLGQSMLDTSKTFPVSAADLLNGAYVALSSGIDSVKTATEVATTAGKAQVAQIGKTADVARVLTSVQNAYGENNISVAATADILAAAIRDSGADANDFIGNIGRLVGIAPKLNIKFSELTATVADLTNKGLKAPEAFTAVLNVMNELEQRSPKQVKALASVGLTFEQVQTSIRDKGFVNTMVDLNKRFDDQGKDIKSVFPAIRGYNGFLLLTAKNGKTAKDQLDGTTHSVGDLDAAVDANKDTLANQVQILQNQFNAAFIEVGQKLIPDVVQALHTLQATFSANEADIKTFAINGLRVAIEAIKDFITGAIEMIRIVDRIGQVFVDIVGPANATAIAVAAIGAALAWALPGGQIIKGLTIITALAGALDKGFDTPIGRFGGEQNRQTGERNLFGRSSLQGEVARKLGGISTSDKVLGFLTPRALRPEDAEADKVIERLKKIGVTNQEQFAKLSAQQLLDVGAITKKEFDEIAKKEADATDETNKRKEALQKLITPEKDLNNAIHAGEQDAAEFAKKMKELSSEFKSTSEKAADFKSPADDLGLFGNIDKKLADALHLTATEAGNVQGYDALQAALSRSQQKAFKFTETMATVAYAFQNSGSVGARIVRDLASASLEASQKALGALFSQPTREVANLNVRKAINSVGQANVAIRVNPQIDALKHALEAIDRQIRDADKAQKQRDKARQRAEDESKKRFDAQRKALDDQLDALKLANTIAQHSFEVQQQQMQDLIDANNEAQSSLQEAFLKSNEELQQQINAAIGAGNESGALALVGQQQQATKAYREQSKTLQEQQTKNEKQLKDAERLEKIREREAQFAEQMAEADKKKAESAIDAAEADAEAAFKADEDSNALDDHKNALEDSKQAIEDQIQSLEDQKSKYDEQGARIQEQIDLMTAQGDVAKALAESQNKLLLTQDEQARVAYELGQQIAVSSDAVRRMSSAIGEAFLPDLQNARLEFQYLQGAMRVAADKGFRETLIDHGIDPATERLKILDYAAGDAAGSISRLGNTANVVPDAMQRAAATILTTADQFEEALRMTGAGGTGHFYADGGYTGELGGIVHPHEWVIPRDKPARAREVIAQIPPSLLASSRAVSVTSVGSVLGGLSVQGGASLDDMRVAAVAAVNQVFNGLVSSASRGGSLITPGVNGGGGIQTTGGGGGGGGLVAAVANRGQFGGNIAPPGANFGIRTSG